MMIVNLLILDRSAEAQDFQARFWTDRSQEWPGHWIGVVCNDEGDPAVAFWMEGINAAMNVTSSAPGWEAWGDGAGGLGWLTEGGGVASGCTDWSFAVWSDAQGWALVTYVIVAESGNFYTGDVWMPAN